MTVNYMGWGEVEVDGSNEYLIITLPIPKLTEKESKFYHKKQAFITVEEIEEHKRERSKE